MAEASDTPDDVVRFIETMKPRGVDCVFGSRLLRGSRVVDYPFHQLRLNRLANRFIQLIFAFRYNDITNA